MKFKLTLRKTLLFLTTIFLFAACSKSHHDPSTGTIIPVDKSKLTGWWARYNNGSKNTPSGNAGYSLIYFGDDSLYLQSYVGEPFTPGTWFLENDSLSVMS